MVAMFGKINAVSLHIFIKKCSFQGFIFNRLPTTNLIMCKKTMPFFISSIQTDTVPVKTLSRHKMVVFPK